MLTEEQLFKVAFLSELAERGIGPEEAQPIVRQLIQQAEKQAEFGISDAVGGLTGAAYGFGKGLAEKSLPLFMGANIAIPAAVGGLGGYALSQMQDVDDEDVPELRTQESIQNYKRLATEMAVRRRLRDDRAGQQQASRPLIR